MTVQGVQGPGPQALKGRMVETPAGIRGPYDESVWMYRLLWFPFYALAKLIWRIEVVGRENLPRGGYIISPIHRSYIDTPVIAAITNKRIRYLGKDSLWRPRFGSWFLTKMGGMPVARGTPDRAALRWCIDRVNDGEPLAMFPEGTRQEGELTQKFYDGPAYVACRTGAPIVPVGLGGTARSMPKGAKGVRPTKVVIVIGEPIPSPNRPGERASRRQVAEHTELLAEKIQALYDEAQTRAGIPQGPGISR